VIYNATYLMVPILFAALGGLFSERAGNLNIGLEGLILLGAFMGIVGTYLTGSILVGMLFGSAAGSILALVYSVACLELRSNIFIAGLAINLLAAGLVPYLSQLIFGTKGVVQLTEPATIPAVLGVSVTVFLAVAVTAVVHYVLGHTRFGIRIRAVGEDPAILESRGLQPRAYQRMAMILSGTFAGFAGAEMALRLGVYVPNISAGRGWIALVAIFLGVKRPFGVLAAATLFAVLDALSGAAQGLLTIPGTLLLGLPHALTLVAMVIYSAVSRRPGIE
jgi:ABC-type uncharacterized transport system permease subunit